MARLDEVAEGVYRINTPVSPTVVPGGFSFNQYLILDDEPLLFHTGSRRLFPEVVEASAGSCRRTGCATSPSPTMNRTRTAR